MNKKIEEIKKTESSPKIVRNIFSKNDIDKFLKLYHEEFKICADVNFFYFAFSS